jgi:hypothetical protein
MKNEFTHIKIESKAFPRDGNLANNQDAASRQAKIARHGLDLLSALRVLVINPRPDDLSDFNYSRRLANYNEAYDNAIKVIEDATGKKFSY